MPKSRLLLVLVSALVPQLARAQQPDAPVSLLPPTSVAGFRMVGQQSSPEAGAELRYQQPGRTDWIDVYIYPSAREGCSRACDSAAVENESNEFAGLTAELVRRGYYDSLRVEADERVALPSGAQPMRGRHLHLRGGREGRVISSQFYLLPAGPVLVKVRATYAPSARMDSVVDEFTRGFVAGAAQRIRACTGGPPQDEGLAMTVDLDQPLDQVRPRVTAALRKLGYELEETEGDEWQTGPVGEWPARGTWDSVRSHPHPGVLVQARAQPHDGKTRLEIHASPICGLPDHRDVETAVALIAATEVMMEFPDARK